MQLDGTTPISTYDESGNLTSAIEWKKLGNVKSTSLTVSGENTWIMGNVYGGGEMGAVTPYRPTPESDATTTATITITGGTIGTEVTGGTPTRATVAVPESGSSSVKYTFGSVYGGGMGMVEYDATNNHGGDVHGTTTVSISGADTKVRGSVFGGGEMAIVGGNANVIVSGGEIGRNEVKAATDADAGYVMFGGATMGNVYGGGKGLLGHTEAGLVKGNTNVNISGGNIYHMVYGGGALGSVGTFTVSTGTGEEAYVPAGIPLHWTEGTGTATVNITGGVIGISGRDNGLVFGSSRGGLSKPVDGLDPYDRVAWVNKSVVNIGTSGSGTTLSTPLIKGSVYGGGENGHNNESATVNVYSGTIGITEKIPGTGTNDPWYSFTDTDLEKRARLNRGNVYGAGSGSDTYTGDDSREYYNPKAGMVAGNTFVNIAGGLVGRSVYGGGAMSSIGTEDNSGSITVGTGTTTVTISGGQIGGDNSEDQTIGNVFGAARGDETTQTGLAQVQNTNVMISNGTVKGSVFGGGERGVTLGNVVVNMTGGTVVKDVYGGGALADTNTGNATNYGTSSETISSTSTYTTTVNLLGGSINDVYGGALGQKAGVSGAAIDIAAIVYGDVKVNLNGLEPADYVADIHSSLVTDVDDTAGTYYRANGGCSLTGNVYGCNNINGTPKGHAKVHVFKTVNSTKNPSTPVASRTTYDVEGVFGGGNATDYVPADADTKQSTEVIIEGCELTSIRDVYGGGYGAAVPGTEVLIKGTYIIDNVFGGGYGASTETYTNPGANVGYRTGDAQDSYGKYPSDFNYKTANVKLMAGTVRHVYGASNTKGDIRGGSSVTTVDKIAGPGNCTELYVDDIYGGGQDAPMAGGAEIVLGCMPNDWIDEVYAGAANGDVGNDVSLTITSGKFGRVFGGNKSGGRLHGGIEVNIEENPACGTPIIIGELYGGGNDAPYSIYGYKDEKDANGKWKPREKADYDALTPEQKATEGIEAGPHRDPTVNVKAFTSIGNIYGGGYGTNATVVGSPTVNINEVEVTHTDTDTEFVGNAYNPDTDSSKPSWIDGTTVKLWPHEDGKMGVISTIFGGGNAAKVIGNTNVNIGTEVGNDIYFESLQGYYPQKVKGADVRGNVYGGGNNAEVTGDTNVVIGRKAE